MTIQSLEYRLDCLENMLLLASTGGEVEHIRVMLEILERKLDMVLTMC